MPRESAAERRRRTLRIARRLAAAYPQARCALHHEDPFQLLVATILSAQCTDKMVNQVTPELFRRYPTPEALADAKPSDVEKLVKPTGFFRQKTRSLLAVSRDLCERFQGRVPQTMEELLTLHGVARKTANVVLGTAFGIPGITVDTHVKRISQRLGLTRHDDPAKIEQDLMELVPESDWILFSHHMIHHGRLCCDSRRPQCEACPIRSHCPWPDSREGHARLGARAGARGSSRRAREVSR